MRSKSLYRGIQELFLCLQLAEGVPEVSGPSNILYVSRCSGVNCFKTKSTLDKFVPSKILNLVP